MKVTTPTAPEELAGVLYGNQSAGRKRRLWTIAAGALLVCVTAVVMFQRARSQTGASSYDTTPLERGDLTLLVTATGNLEPTNKVTVGSELSGTATEVYVESNDQVTKGQPLAKLDPRKFVQQTESSRAAFNSAKAKVRQTKATAVEKESTLNRAQELQRLSGGKTPSKADMDTAIAAAERARADLASAEASAEEAEAQLKSNETDLSKTTIVAPIDGTVLTRSLEPGQTVAASFTTPELFVIAENLKRMKLKVSVAEADIAGVQSGQLATFTVDAWPNRSYSAKVTKVAYGSTVTDNVVTYKTELEVANEDLSLRPGMTATVDIRTVEAKGVFLVPAAALRFDPNANNSAAGGEAPQGESFLQRIVPGPPRTSSRPKAAAGNSVPERKSATDSARLWVLRNGQPEAVTVKVGLSNGRVTEVSGAGLAEGTPIITRFAASQL